jgi:uncharacterized protein with GYD domain
MTIFITQARFTKDGLKGMVASPEDRAEVVGRLIGEVGGKLMSYYMTSGDYDVLLIFEAASYQDVVPALVVAAAGGGVADLKTVTALKSSDMKSAFTKAGSIALSYRPPAVPAVNSAVPEQKMAAPTPDSQNGEAPDETQDEAKTAAKILDARKKTMEDIEAGRPAPYYFGSSTTSTSRRGKKPSADPAKK